MEEKILNHLKELVGIASITDTETEKLAAEYLIKAIRQQTYFLQFPDQCGRYMINQDYLGRSIPYGLVKGNSPKTIILTGHYDVAGVEEYGQQKTIAFQIDQLTDYFKQQQIWNEELRQDIESGEWIFGRGTADMKGGLASALAVMELYGSTVLRHQNENFCNLLFVAVPGEESYSKGMRGAIPLLTKLKEQYGLSYEACIDLEPCSRNQGCQELFLGSVGTCMPIILVQGAKAHIGECFKGISALAVLNQFFQRTELSAEFSERYEQDVCMPPVWLALKDLKEEYDASLPHRAYGYLKILSYESAPEAIIKRLKNIARQVWEQAEAKVAVQERMVMGDSYKNTERSAGKVLELRSLIQLCRDKNPQEFEQYYEQLCNDINEKIIRRECNVPEAAAEVMRRLLDWSAIEEPLILIGFAPIYYPAYHSDRLEGKVGAGSKIYSVIEQAAEVYHLKLQKRHYFGGISDLSYCGISSQFQPESYSLNTPLWDQGFSIDLEGIQKLNIPAILFGPWGKDIHQKTERVHLQSLTVELPHIIWNVLRSYSQV